MKQYLDFMRHVRDNGRTKGDRTGTGTLSAFSYQMRFDLSQGFPLLTTKKLHLRSIIHELIWFLSGSTNIKYLKDNGVKIWDDWADKDGNLGKVYGHQWRSWEGANGETIDQISQVIEQIKTNPDSRRLLVSAWNVADIPNMKLPPCHALFQFYTEELTGEERIAYADAHGIEYAELRQVFGTKRYPIATDGQTIPTHRLSCQLYQRSADIFLGVPFNIASYALLTHMIAQQVGMIPGGFIWTGGDCHIYSNHMEQVREQLSRTPRNLPTLKINHKPDSIFDYKLADFEFIDYDPYPHISAPVAV